MNRFGPAVLAFTLVGALACQRNDEVINQKLDDIGRRLNGIESKLGNAPAAGAGAGAAARGPQRAAPDPAAVYAVPIGESASIGSKLAKVTIVEAFTFT